ncbi:Zn-dependent exopeptidase [Amylostereum chailletii]|nr:Zn-dependent exopeptidase [Amylostereum chailletii]
MHLFPRTPRAALLALLAAAGAHALHLAPPRPRSERAQCVTADAWPPGPGDAFAPQAPAPDLQHILSQIDADRVNATIARLVGFGTRHTLSTQTDPARGIGAARDWIAAQMRAYAAAAPVGTNVAIGVPSYIQQPEDEIPFAVNVSNVIATIQGSEEPNRVYIITGHYDSRNSNISDFENAAPGADDDGSGVAIVMELVRIMSTVAPPKATIMLGAVAGEEQGLFGSTFFAQTMKDAGADAQGMFTNDIVGSSKSDEGVVDAHSIRLFAQGIPSTATAAQAQARVTVGGENDSPARELSRFVQEVASNTFTDMSVRVIYRLDRFLRGGDHKPFLQQGFPAARFTEPNENFAHQHQDVRVDRATGVQFGDLLEFCDMPFIARVAKVNAAAIWSLAQAPGTPKGVALQATALANNSTLAWTLDASASVAGYEVVWRPTDAPDWTDVVPVGLVDQATVPLSKDNVIFGVRAVGTNGYRSPATFPCAGC